MKTKLLMLMALCALLASCGNNEKNQKTDAAAPVLTAVSPEPGATGVLVSTSSVVFSYDQNIKISLADQSRISITPEVAINSVNAYNNTITVSISGLEYATTYTVEVPEGAVNGFKSSQKAAAAASTSFTTENAPVDPGTDERLSDVAWDLAAALGLGWNMGNHMDAFNGTTPSETVWGNAKCTQATFTKLKQAGFKSVRIPVTWLDKIGPAPGYKIDEAWLDRVAEIVGYAETAGLYAIVNTHHDECNNDGHWLNILAASVNPDTNESIKAEIKAVWTQIADRFKDKGEWLILESFNEIQDGGWGNSAAFRANPSVQCNVLNQWNQAFVDAVRATGGNNATRWLGVPTYAANPGFVDYFVMPSDPAGKMMLAFHCYDPYDFTIGDAQYSDWGHTGKAGNKANGSDEEYFKALFNKFTRNYVNKGIPVYIGEFGCSMRNKSDSRSWAFYKYYLEYVVKAAKTYGLPAFLWDNGAPGYGKECHGYINHGTGDYMGDSKEVVDIMTNAMNNASPAYTLETVYAKAPKN